MAKLSDLTAGGGGSLTLLSRQVFTTSGTWTKPAVAGKQVRVIVGGGGGGSGGASTNGGASSFAGVSAGGGQSNVNSSNDMAFAMGGYGLFPGMPGMGAFMAIANGRAGLRGVPLGAGRSGSDGTARLGGEGGVTIDTILFDDLMSTETVTVGAGGAGGNSYQTPGAGFVVIEVWG